MAYLPNSKAEALEDDDSFLEAMQLCFSASLGLMLGSVAELGVFDVLQKAGEAAKLSAKEIASELSCNNPEAPSMLDRLLALLASYNILNCSLTPDNQNQNLGSSHRLYSITPVARFFAPNSDGVSLVPLMTLFQDTTILQIWPKMKDAIREGGIPFNMTHGTHLFKYLSLDSRFNQVFNTAMMNQTALVMKKVLECYKGFEDVRRLVDVGGGLGININMITSKYPHIQGINFDLPHVIQNAPSYHGVEHVAGDMFESVPKGDAIFMKWILHDWSDEWCVKLLKNCYDAIPEDGKVIIVETVLPIMPESNDAWRVGSQSDAGMMIFFKGGKERSEDELKQLAIAAGFAGITYKSNIPPFSVLEFFK